MQSNDKQSSADSPSDNISSRRGKHATAGWHLTPQAALQGWILLGCWVPPRLGGEHKPKEPSVSHLMEKIHRLPNQSREKGATQEPFPVLNTLDGPHRGLSWLGLVGLFDCRVCTSQLTASMSPHVSMKGTSLPAMKTEVTKNGKHSASLTHPTT